MFNLIHPSSGNKVAFMMARTDLWGRHQMVNRRQVRITETISGIVSSPEDIILAKLLYYREGGSEKHLRDITGIIHAGRCQADRRYIDHWASELGVMDPWQLVLQRLTDTPTG